MTKLGRIAIMLAFTLTLGSPSFGHDGRLPSVELKDVELRGTVISGVFRPIAIVEDKNTGKSCWFQVGDAFCGGRIVEIQRGAVVLDMDGSRCIFGLPAGAVVDGGMDFTEEPGGSSAPGKRVGDNVWTVELEAAIETLTDIGGLMKEVRIKPYFAIGRAAGVRVDNIKEGSIIREMGIMDGDVVKGVTGFGLMSPVRIFEAYRKYKNDDLIELQLLREGEPVTLTYNIVR